MEESAAYLKILGRCFLLRVLGLDVIDKVIFCFVSDCTNERLIKFRCIP